MGMLAYLPVSIQTQDMHRQRLAIPERAWREQRTADDFQEVSVLQPTVSMIVIAKNTGVDSATMYPCIRSSERR
jgi:hypothetical protein